MAETTRERISTTVQIPAEVLDAANLRPLELVAYEVIDARGWTLTPAPVRREWMQANDSQAYRCLPMTIANAAGWAIGCPTSFVATWNGSIAKGGVRFDFADPFAAYARVITDHFGNGIVTFNLPWLFRTSRPRVGLNVRGLPNEPKFNATPLEGFVETDWLPFTFTMNWKIQRPGQPVQFVKGEPIAFIQPASLDFAEATEPRVAKLEDNGGLAAEYAAYEASRAAYNANPRRKPEEWQRSYHIGSAVAEPPAHHRTAIKVAPFEGLADGRR